MANGLFIAFEGIDGSGTTTQAALLHRKFAHAGVASLLTCEPTEGRIGKLIREVLAKDASEKVEADALALLFAADRIEHYRKKILPFLQTGNVISDRFVYSSLAYQSVFCEKEFIWTINSKVPFADICFWLKIPAQAGIDRIGAANRGGELFERLEILEKVSENYEQLALTRPESSMVILDGTKSVEDIHEEALNTLATRFGIKL